MRKLALFFAILSSLVTASCIRRAPSNADRNVNDAFGIVVNDTQVNLTGPQELKPQLNREANGQVNFLSRDWLDFSRRLFEAADVLGGTNLFEGRLRLIKMAHEISQLYYSSANSSTVMTATLSPPGNPYLEEAYYYVKDILNKQYQTTMTNASAHVTSAAAQIKIKDGPKLGDGAIDMNAVFDVIISVFDDFIKNLKTTDDDTTAEVTEQIAAKVQVDYINFLKSARDASNMTGPTETSLSYTTRVQNMIKSAPGEFLPDDVKAAAAKGLQEVLYFAGRVDQCTTVENTMQTFIDLWNSKDNRAKYPKDVNTAVRAAFKNYKDEEIVAMLDDNKDGLVAKDQWAKVSPNKAAIIKSISANPVITAYATTLMDSPVNPAQNGADVFAALVNNWYNMDFRSNLTEMKALWRFTEDDLNKMYKINSPLFWQGHIILSVARSQIISLLSSFNTAFPNSASFKPGIDWFKGYVNYKIIHAIQKEIADEIIKTAPSVPEQIRVATLKTLTDLKVASKQNVGDLFKSLSASYMDKWLFNGQSHLPLIEKNQVNFTYNDHQLAPLKTPSETSAEVMGIGFSNAVERLNSLDYVNLKPDQPEVRTIAFQALCKMAALTGYTGVDDKPVLPLMRLFNSTKKTGNALDLANYDPDQATYAAADSIVLKNNYKLDLSNSDTPKASVRGQMELLAGLTKMIQYLKPWNPTTFDATLSNLRIAEFPTQTVFDKSSMFQQALGLAATIVKNIPSRMVALITLDGAVVPMSQVKDLSTLELGGAVLTDFDQKTISHTIRTHDLAFAVISISEFFDAMKDLSSSKDKSVRDAAAQIESQRPLINQLFLGISMFSLSKLMAEDGGFVAGYDLDRQAPSLEPRTLSDQLLMEEALLVIGDYLNRNFIRLRAIDNFFFLNSTFWNDQLGFYSASDQKGNNANLKLADVAEAIKNTVLIRPLLSTLADANPALRPSLKQLDTLQKFWMAKFFSDDIANIPTILKLGNFTPAVTARAASR